MIRYVVNVIYRTLADLVTLLGLTYAGACVIAVIAWWYGAVATLSHSIYVGTLINTRTLINPDNWWTWVVVAGLFLSLNIWSVSRAKG